MSQKTSYQEIDSKKKRMSLDFRRFITWRSRGAQVRGYLGADIGEIREWIESNFMPGMTWGNYGSVWVIDHIVPLRMFDLSNVEDLKIVWHYKNLMPLLKRDNLKKEGNAFFAFELLHELKGKDCYFKKLYDRVLPEVEWMIKYIDKFHRRYRPARKGEIRHIKAKDKTAA